MVRRADNCSISCGKASKIYILYIVLDISSIKHLHVVPGTMSCDEGTTSSRNIYCIIALRPGSNTILARTSES